MRVEIKIDPNIEEEAAVVHVKKMTPKLVTFVEMLEQEDETPSLLFSKIDNKLIAVEAEQIDIIRTEDNDVKLYNRQGQEYTVTKPLHELQEQLGSGFVRISKSTIININRIDHLTPLFNRTMLIAMKNGITDYISRKHLGDVKKRLGL